MNAAVRHCQLDEASMGLSCQRVVYTYFFKSTMIIVTDLRISQIEAQNEQNCKYSVQHKKVMRSNVGPRATVSS